MASAMSFLSFFLICSLSLGFGYEGDEGYPYTPGSGGGDEGYPYIPGGGGGFPFPPSGGGGGGGEIPFSPPYTPSGGGGGGEKEEMFLLRKTMQVLKGEAGEFRVVKGFEERGIEKPPMHIGYINMEPQSLFVPQYLDSNLIIYVARGSAKIGWINKAKLAETKLKAGDLFRIPAGSPFYIVNTGEGQRLQMICSIDTTGSLGMKTFQSFFVAGGLNPRTVITGFGLKTILAAFNVTAEQFEAVFARQIQGPVIYVTNTTNTSSWDSILQLKHQQSPVEVEDDSDNGQDSWIWRKLMNFVVTTDNKKNKLTESESSDTEAYNINDRKPDFKNDYGLTKAVTQKDYAPLGKSGESGVGVFYVALNAGAMLAPHVNPSAIEFAIVLNGSGTVEIVYPNGTTAMRAEVHVGDLFWIPKYFPFCQIASRDGPFVFVGFTTNAFENNPQFLAGESSVYVTMNGPELAMSLGVDQDILTKFVKAQNQSIIVSSVIASPPYQPGGGGSGEHGKGDEGGHGKGDKGGHGKGGSGEHGKGDKGGHGKGGSGEHGKGDKGGHGDLKIELWA